MRPIWSDNGLHNEEVQQESGPNKPDPPTGAPEPKPDLEPTQPKRASPNPGPQPPQGPPIGPKG